MTNIHHERLEGITLDVYLYIVRKGKPVGPRDAMKGAHLSSPSVAYRHLQKLEDLDLLKKNEYGEYLVKNKAPMEGYFWVGNRVLPKMFTYSIPFITILIIEIAVLGIHYTVETEKFKIFFSLLIIVTAFATAVFVIEGLLQRRRTKKMGTRIG